MGSLTLIAQILLALPKAIGLVSELVKAIGDIIKGFKKQVTREELERAIINAKKTGDTKELEELTRKLSRSE